MDDLISREAAIKSLMQYVDGKKTIGQCIDELPPVTPKQRTGHWIKHNTFEKWECSCCGVQFRFSFKEHYFCPNCGAKMVEPQESEGKDV